MIELGNREIAEYYSKVRYVGNKHVQVLSSFTSVKKLSLARCSYLTDVSPLSSLTSLLPLLVARSLQAKARVVGQRGKVDLPGLSETS